MNKQTFKIPEGCTEISVEQDGDKLIATFGKKFEPKEGDVCAMAINGFANPLIFFYTRKRGDYAATGLNAYGEYMDRELALYDDAGMLTLRPATTEESKKLFDALEKEGLQWDAENKKVVKTRWKPVDGEPYWFFNRELEAEWVNWHGNTRDLIRKAAGNCFKTKEITIKAIESTMQTLKKFHNEN